MGVEVGTGAGLEARRRPRAVPRGRRQHARPRAGGLLPHTRRSCRGSCRPSASPCTCRSAPEHELTGIVDVLHMCAYTSPEGAKEGDPVAIPDEMADLAQTYREKLLDAVVETDEALMERYLEGEELDPHDVAAALKARRHARRGVPGRGGVATKNLGTHALLDLLVEGVPSPAKKGAPIDVDGAGTAAFVFKTIADPFAGQDQPLPRAQGHGDAPSRRCSTCARRRRSAWGRCSSSRARSTHRRRSSARATSARSRS